MVARLQTKGRDGVCRDGAEMRARGEATAADVGGRKFR